MTNEKRELLARHFEAEANRAERNGGKVGSLRKMAESIRANDPRAVALAEMFLGKEEEPS